MDEDPEKRKKRFGIGHFHKEKTQDGKKVVELLPRRWLDFIDGKWVCRWPPPGDEKFIMKWVQTEEEPQDDWILCDDGLDILCWADTYEAGLRRLDRALFQLENIATDTDRENARSTVSRMSRDRARGILTANQHKKRPADSSSDDEKRPMSKKKKIAPKKKKMTRGKFPKITDSEEENDPKDFPRDTLDLSGELSSSKIDETPSNLVSEPDSLSDDSQLRSKKLIQSSTPKSRSHGKSPQSKTPEKSPFSHLRDLSQRKSPPRRVSSGLSQNAGEILRQIQNRQEGSTFSHPGCSKDSLTPNKAFPNTPKSHLDTALIHTTPLSSMSSQNNLKYKAKRVEDLRKEITDPALGALADYLGAKVDLGFEMVAQKVVNSKRSMNYDFKVAVEKLSFAKVHEQESGESTSWLSVFGNNFPFRTVEEFDQFERSLNPLDQADDEEKKEATRKQNLLKSRFKSQISQLHEFSKCVNHIIGEHIDRDVQLLFSAQGRVCSNLTTKRAYVKTISYKCMEEVILAKFTNPPIPVTTATTNYLTGAKSRKAKTT